MRSTNAELRNILGKAFLDAMGRSHVASFDNIAHDAIDKCLKAQPSRSESHRKWIKNLCLNADIADLTDGILVIEKWYLITEGKMTAVPMVRNTLRPRPPRRLQPNITR